MELRPLSSKETRLLNRLLEENFPGREQIATQLKNSLVEQIDQHGCLEFHNVEGSPANVKSRIPVEGEFEDADGVSIHVLLHVVDKRIKSLEIYKDDSSEIIRMPEPRNLRLFRPE